MKKNIFLKDFTWDVKEVKLVKSYKLSYKTLYSYESCIVQLYLNDNSVLTGEVTPLVGYTDETIESVINEFKNIKELIIEKNIEEIRLILSEKITIENSFAYSAILPQIEEYIDDDNYNVPYVDVKDLVYAYDFLDYKSNESIQHSINKIISEGYKTLKIKLGKNILVESNFIKQLNNINLKGLDLRFDANGGYTLDETKEILSIMHNTNYVDYIQYLEQPVDKKAWKDLELLCEFDTKVNIMIDESIYSLKDIKKCAKIGAKFIKLKLCKFGSLQKTQDALDYALSLGLQVVFGNGVATDISNRFELIFYYKNKNKIYDAVESVGFLKLKESILYNIKVDNEK